MALLEWKQEYSVAVKIFNDDHKRLLGYLNELDEALRAGFKAAEMGYIVKGLIDYTIKHFQREEKLMIKYGYPEYEQHKKEHNELIDEVNAFYDDFTKGKKSFSLALLEFLQNWITNHILKTDMKYKEFFVEVAKLEKEEK